MSPSTTSSIASLGNIGRWAVAPLLTPFDSGLPTHTTLSHTTSYNFVTDNLSHTTLSHAIFHTHTHNFVTHTIFHTQLCHKQLCHTQLFDTQLCHKQPFTHNSFTHFHTQLFTYHHLLCPIFFLRAASTTFSDYWKMLTCGVIRSFILSMLLYVFVC